ncbi:MAG: crossover junction endodeoxyribonuclease RuvC [Oscillospiraceae bacterium]|nr:crossover junction endodeoxyribonuclease RuvC [Oscillospiraceae bacterium]
MRILGVDPGFAIVGYGVLDYNNFKFARVASGVITTPPGPLAPRLKQIFSELCKITATFKPDHVAVEKLFFAKNQKTAIDVAQARGVVMLTAVQSDIPVFEYTPLQIKQALVGYGKAGKKQMIAMVARLLGFCNLKLDDEADAIAIALCHAHSFREIDTLGKKLT